MPIRPPKTCAHPGCPKLTQERYCADHKRESRRKDDERRGTAQARGYDKRWSKKREIYVQNHPFCVTCLAEGILTATEIVHHIVPKSEGGTDEDENLESQCLMHHNKLHQGFKGREYYGDGRQSDR